MKDNFEETPATFNIALGYINSIIYSLSLCQDYARNKEYKEWFFELHNLHRIISSRLKPEEIAKCRATFKVIERQLRGATGNEGWMDLYVLLNDLEMDIRRLIKDKGLEMKEGDDPRKALLR